jgi:Bacteriophage holin of superfamily 6 (Holin_LLH)
MTAQQLILFLLPLLLPYVIAHAFALGAELYHRVLGRLPANQRAILEYIATKAVTAAEQKYKSLNGSQKRLLSESTARALCAHLDVPQPSAEALDAFIEAAVAGLDKAASEDTMKRRSTLPSVRS